VRNPEGRNKEAATALTQAGAVVVDIDVTSDESVTQGVASAIEQLGGLDVVVNNAGVGVTGIQEHFTPDDWKRVFEVNVFGVQRVNRAVLPHLRQQGQGLLVHISSLLGRITMPFYGPYNASKWALEAMAENYRVELSSFGVESTIVEPGGFATNFIGNLIKPSDDSRNVAYGPMMDMPEQAVSGFEQNLEQNKEVQNPQFVADAIVNVIEAPHGQRPFRTVVDNIGMGDPIRPYNEQLEGITQGLYTAFGMEGMLKVKV